MWVDYKPVDDGYRSIKKKNLIKHGHCRGQGSSPCSGLNFSGLPPRCLVSDKNYEGRTYSFHYLLSNFPLSAFVLNRIIQSH